MIWFVLFNVYSQKLIYGIDLLSMTEETQKKISNLRHLLKEKAPLVYKLYASRKIMESSIKSINMRGAPVETSQPIVQQLQDVKK